MGTSPRAHGYPIARKPDMRRIASGAMDGDRERCIEAGMKGYISKPIRVDELVDAILTTPPSGK